MMASLVVRNIDESVKARLRMRASRNGHSMEAEVRHILKDAVERDPAQNLADLALEIFGSRHGVDLEIPRPATDREPPDFSSE
jgi:plasmid stability protein